MNLDQCEFIINGKRISESAEDLRRLRDYIDRRLHWLASAPRFDEIYDAETLRVDRPETDLPTPTIGHTPRGQRIIDYIMIALRELGGASDLKLTFNKSLAVGWKPNSKLNRNQVFQSFNSIARSSRYRGYLEVAGGRIALKPDGLEEAERLLADFPDLYNLGNARSFSEASREAR